MRAFLCAITTSAAAEEADLRALLHTSVYMLYSVLSMAPSVFRLSCCKTIVPCNPTLSILRLNFFKLWFITYHTIFRANNSLLSWWVSIFGRSTAVCKIRHHYDTPLLQARTVLVRWLITLTITIEGVSLIPNCVPNCGYRVTCLKTTKALVPSPQYFPLI